MFSRGDDGGEKEQQCGRGGRYDEPGSQTLELAREDAG
jgi:hypothetical protein